MTDRYPNIFYNLIKNETSLTEAFCNFMIYKSFRNHFVNFIKNKKTNFEVLDHQIEFENFKTEKEFKTKEFENLGRGDFILELDEKEYIFEFKVETTTGFTNNQPDGYIKYLEEKGQDKDDLYFFLPKNYNHKLEKKDINKDNIFFWEDFIQSLKDSGLIDITYINDFCKILDNRWFYFEKFEFNKFEINITKNQEEINMTNKILPTIMMKLYDIVEELEAKYSNKCISKEKDSIEYGFYFKNEKNNAVLWFGIDFLFWEENGYPITLAISTEKDDETYLNEFKNINKDKLTEIKYENETSYYHLPIEINESMDTNKIKEIIDNTIRNIGLKLRK